MKICTKCGGNGPFYKDKQKKDGLSSHCGKCKHEATKEYVRTHKEQVKAADRTRRSARYRKNVQKANEQSREWQKAHPDKVRTSALKSYYKCEKRFRKYGLTRSQFQEMLDAQESKCAICSVDVKKPSHQHIDHNHETKQVRMILCPRCNMGLGHFSDSVFLLEKAAAYLRGFSEPF